VLIVEDDRAARRAIGAILRKRGNRCQQQSKCWDDCADKP